MAKKKNEVLQDEIMEMVETAEVMEPEEKVEEKVETKTATKRAKTQTKECDVLIYNAGKKFIVIAFDGLGFRLDYDGADPGAKIRVKYAGKIGTPTFKLEVA